MIILAQVNSLTIILLVAILAHKQNFFLDRLVMIDMPVSNIQQILYTFSQAVIKKKNLNQIMLWVLKRTQLLKLMDMKIYSIYTGPRVKSSKFGHQVNSDTHLQTV